VMSLRILEQRKNLHKTNLFHPGGLQL